MENRKILTKLIDVQLSPYEAWTQRPITPELINACKNFQAGDIVREFKYVEKTEVPFGSMDDNEVTLYSPIIVVERKMLESDEEFFKRMKQVETIKKQTEERERLEFLRLKAKFEPES